MSHVSSAQTWHKLGTGVAYPGQNVSCLKVINGDLYVGGSFGTMYGGKGNCVAKYNSFTEKWDSVGVGMDNCDVKSIEEYNGEIYAGGYFPGVGYWPPLMPYTKNFAKWNGSQWGPVDTSFAGKLNGSLYFLKTHNNLYIGGYYSGFSVNNGIVHNITRYNGSSFDNMLGGVSNMAFTMTIYKGDLIVAGDFSLADFDQNIQVNRIARWDGTKWDSLGSGLNGGVRSLTVDTVNDILYVGGGFTMAGGLPAYRIAKWDGTAWDTVARWPTFSGPYALKMFNGKLYAGTRSLYGKWSDTTLLYLDAQGWHPIMGPNETIFALEVYNGNLYAGGAFSKIDTTLVNCIACYGDSCPGTPINLTLPYGVNELKAEAIKFKVFPNPAKQEITVQVPGEEPIGNRKKYVLRIKNALGQEIYKKEFEKELKIDSSTFKKGICFAEVCTQDGRACRSEKVVIQ